MQIDRILGNVGVLYVGAYNSSTKYEYLNCVTYNGSSYVCVNQDGVTGVTPGTTNDWQLSAQKGDTGGQGIQGEQGIQGTTGNGIQSIEKTSSNALTDTYTILFTDGSSTTFEVENGKGIVSIEKTSSEGNVDTYTITYNDDTTSTFTVTNGQVTNEELQQAFAQERVISDGKYARALKTQVTDVKSTQIYAENDVVDDLIINGVELTQETRDGYNKFNLDTIAENNYIDGYYENDSYGVLVGSSATNTSDYIEVKAGQSYLLKYDYDTLMNTGNRGFAFYNTNKEVINQKKNTMYNPSNKSNIFTAPNQDGYLRFSYDINCTNIQLVDGPSPSLDFPSEVQVASEQNIQICQNNYLNTTQIANKDFSNSGLTVTTDENGIFTVNGTNTNQVNIDFSNLNFKVKEGQKLKIIKISGDISQSDNILNYINVLLWDKNYNTISLLNINNSNVNYTDIVNRIQVRFIIPSSTSSITYTNFKFGIMVVNADDNIQDYQPYYGTDITIALTNSAIGQYADTIDRENSVQNKFIQELTLTGSESDWTREDTAVGTRFFKPLQNSIISNTDNSYALCTHFKLTYSGGTYNVVGNLFTIYSVGSTNRIGFGSFTDISTVDEWKAKLKELYDAGTPVKVYYVAETVDKIPLSEEVKKELNKFKLYDDLNNIFIDNGALSFKYNKSLSKELEEKDEMIDNLLTRIQALEQAQINSVT